MKLEKSWKSFKKRNKNYIKRKVILFSIFLIFFYGIYSIYFPQILFGRGEEKEFIVKEGEGAWEIINNLSKEGLLKRKLFFILYLFLTGKKNRIQPGVHYLNSQYSLKKLAQVITRVKKREEITIRIKEGWTLWDIADYFSRLGFISKNSEFFKFTGVPGQLNNRLDLSYLKNEIIKEKPKELSLEGYLFPDTYRIYKDSKVEEIIALMINNLESKLGPKLKEEIKKKGRTIHEVLTVASILEKEIQSFEDKKLVADLIYRRLKEGMPLQIDATVNYVTRKWKPQVSLEDIKEDSPYNTYKYKGLPPGPISNPSLESILAAIYPQKNNFWYYLTTPEGKVIFSKSFKEHKENKRKYLY